MNEIVWPEGYLPGFTDNFASNEMIVAGLSVAEVWPWLNTPSLWPSYYSNSDNIRFLEGKGPELEDGVRFYFETFGFPVDALVIEHVAPAAGQAARIAWHGWAGDDEETRLDVHHAWLLEDLSGGRLRILTQESQKGRPAQALAAADPNPMINGHDQWLKGLVAAALKAKQTLR